MKTITKRIIWDIGLFLVTVMLTFIVTTNMSPKTPVEPAAIVLDTPQPEIVEKIVEVVVTKEVVITATPKPATATPTPTPTPAATLGPISAHASLICFTSSVEQAQIEQYLAGQADLPSGAKAAQILDSGYVLMASVPSGGYKVCVFSYELNRGGGDGLALALYGHGADEPFDTYTLQSSSLEPQRVYALVSHSLVINPNGRWIGVSKLIDPNSGVLLVDNLSLAGNKTAVSGGGGDGGGGGGGGGGYP